MIKTGVRVSKEHLDQVLESYRQSEGVPLIFPSGLKSAERLDERIEEHKKLIDRLAVEYALPPAPVMQDGEVNHYGMMADGEFVIAEEVPDPR